MKTFFSIILGAIMMTSSANAQITFTGFDQEQCGLINNHGFTYQNIWQMCGSHSYGYKIFKDGNLVYEKCIQLGGCQIKELMFISSNKGFMVESNPNGHAVYQTTNSGNSWEIVGFGAPTYLGFHLLNEHTGYLITTWNSPLVVYISRVSDIRTRMMYDTEIDEDLIIQDTIFGAAFCNYDTLSFQIMNGDFSLRYKIALHNQPLNINEDFGNDWLDFYPNPASEFITICGKAINEGMRINILDMNGRRVKTFSNLNEMLDISDLQAGLYLLEAESRNGVFRRKILKY